ncbi:MAG: polyphosphate:AMP phosphotransferase [Deltaproteobacteria bacterium]|nr:polyphosphate:AMP phosphotransferase [Deltaproteobacteria bacterium]
MFESAELGHKISKEEYDKEVPELRKNLLEAQLDLRDAGKFQVIILIGGVDGAGRGPTVRLLNEWMDARYIETNAMSAPTEEESAHPDMWRFWRSLPPKGKIGIFFGSWYTQPIVERVFKKTKDADLDESAERIIRLERMLHDEGALILKFWMHLSKDAQKKRLKKLEKDKEKGWRASKVEWEHFKLYDKFRKVSERVLRRTSTAEAPWMIVEGADARYRHLTVGKTILNALKERLAGKKVEAAASLPSALPPIDGKFLIKSLKYSQATTKNEYEKKLLKHQRELREIVEDSKFKKTAAILVFEGSDAAGKGGAIRRITGALDPRSYRIVPVAAPTGEEKQHPYLWRFWRHIPRSGSFVIFDRSWYGRVLVERVEGFCSDADWMRAYSEINDFEEQIADNGVTVLKFWLSISKDEQLKRFKERERIAFKHFKITDEDWRNREKWDKYELAVDEMIDRTSTDVAPWVVIEANNKYFARLKILKELCAHLKKAL